MKTRRTHWLVVAALIMLPGCVHVSRPPESNKPPDKNSYIFLCFGQSNMEGFPGIEEHGYKAGGSRLSGAPGGR